jgi:hypothetical protein
MISQDPAYLKGVAETAFIKNTNPLNKHEMAEQETSSWELPEETVLQIIEKINAHAVAIRNDWSDPRSECRDIWRLCGILKSKIDQP